MYERHVIGKQGEEIATNFLLSKGYKIIERNFYCRQGEIDIIAIDKQDIVFIEVKSRTNGQYGKPAEAVDSIKQKHIYQAAQYYLYCIKQENHHTRIDVIEIYLTKKTYQIHYIKNAIQ